jgi:uncharacterized protein (DUF1800 family)
VVKLWSDGMSFDEVIEAGGINAPVMVEQADTPSRLPPAPVAVFPVVALALSACGGGSTSSSSNGPVVVAPPAPPPPPPPAPITGQSAGRFLAQSTMGTAPTDGAAVISKGFDGWLSDQFNTPRTTTFYDWLIAKGYNDPKFEGNQEGFNNAVWKQLITGQDQLRQRVGTALLSILVVGIDGINMPYRQFSAANYLDILWDNAFGNFRTILEKVTLSAAMGSWLSHLDNRKAQANGSQPDENYAREIMQLFSLGLYQLNLDGTQKLSNGKPVETYTQEDITGLARVFTGWVLDGINYNALTPDYTRKPMIQNASRHELGTKTFLGTTIPANTDGVASLKIALDTIFAHPNVAPFISKQLIQHLVTSNPTPAYVQRVATVFENNGSSVRGDMRAVVRAILIDSEARNDTAAQSSTSFGKLREPVMRFTAWARAFGATSPSDTWALPDTSAAATSLGQQVGRSPSVFNWFRPGYTPPNTSIASQSLVGPEFQITNEPTVIAYINFMASAIGSTWGDFKADYTAILTKAADSQALLDEVNRLVAANQISAATIAQIKTAVDSIASDTPANLQRRVAAAILLIMSSPEFITIK